MRYLVPFLVFTVFSISLFSQGTSCQNAQTIKDSPFNLSDNQFDGQESWYRFNPPSKGIVIICQNASVVVYDDCSGKLAIGKEYFGCSTSFISGKEYEVSPNDVIYLKVQAGIVGSSATFYFISTNSCEDGVLIDCGVWYSGFGFSTQDEQNTYVQYNCMDNTENIKFNGRDQLLKVKKSNPTHRLTVNVFNNAGLDLFLLEDCNPAAPVCLKGRNIDANQASLNWIIESDEDEWAAGTYGLVVDAVNGDNAADYGVMVTCGRLDCGSATEITCGVPTPGNTISGANNISAYQFGGYYQAGNTGNELLYYFDVDYKQAVSISMTMNSEIDLDLFLLTDCDEYKCIGKSNDSQGKPEKIDTILNKGRHYVLVEGWDSSEGDFILTVNADCAKKQFDCEGATSIQCGELKSNQTFEDATNAISSYPCAEGNSTFTGREKMYTFTLSEAALVEFRLLVNDPVSEFDFLSPSFFLIKDCDLATCQVIQGATFGLFSVSEQLSEGTYSIIIEEGLINNFDLLVNWQCTATYDICDVGGAFITNGLPINGKLTRRDFPVLGISDNECIPDNYPFGIPANHFFDTYVFYYDPEKVNGDLSAFLSSTSENLFLSVNQCSENVIEPHFRGLEMEVPPDCIDSNRDFVNVENTQEGYYYFVVAGEEGTEYTLNLTPDGPCDIDALQPISCNEEPIIGSFADKSSNEEKVLNYSCYEGDRFYSGLGVLYTFELFGESIVDIILEGEIPMGMFLFGPECGERCMGFRETELNSNLASFSALPLKQGIYYLVIDTDPEFQGIDQVFFQLSLSCQSNFSSSLAFTADSEDCPRIENTPHLATFNGLAGTSLRGQSGPALDDARIVFWYKTAIGWLERSAEAFWDANNPNLTVRLSEDAPGGDFCGYKPADTLQMQIQLVDDDANYDAPITISGSFIPGLDSFIYRTNGISIIENIEEVVGAPLTKLDIDLAFICHPSREDSIDLNLFSNVNWRIEKVLNETWFSTDRLNGNGDEVIKIKFDPNSGGIRRDTLLIIGEDGSLRVLPIEQKANCPDFSVDVSPPMTITCANPTVTLDGFVSSLSPLGVDYMQFWIVRATNNVIAGPNIITDQAGWHVFVVSNGTCEKRDSVLITRVAPFTASIVTEDVQCVGFNNGTAQINITGGTPGFIIDWWDGNNTADLFRDDLPALGNSIVMIRDQSGCEVPLTYTINEPSALSATISIGADGTSATVSASGGNGNYSVLWSNNSTGFSISGLTEGNYTATVTDAKGCTTSASIEITSPCSGPGCGSNNKIFTDFPWLSNIVDPNNCSGETISVYTLGAFQYIFIGTGTNSGELYLDNGTFYCTSTSTYDCVAAYNLTQLDETWTCGGGGDPGGGDSGGGDPGGGDSGGGDPGGGGDPMVNPGVFNDFPWLNNIVDPNNCSGEIIYVYTSGAFQYIFIEIPGTNSGELYLDNGTFYCTSSPNYDCVAAYNLTQLDETWTCGDGGNSGGGSGGGGTGGGGTGGGDDPIVSAVVFDDFPWLTNIVDPNNCSGEIIYVYTLGAFQYIFIGTGTNSGELYLDNGTFYCTSSPNYDCVAAYNLTQLDETWVCPSNLNEESNKNRNNKKIHNNDFRVFPNPTQGGITVQIPVQSEHTQWLRIFDIYGRIIIKNKILPTAYTKTRHYDLAPFSNGIYLVELYNETEKKVLKVMKQD